MKKFNWLKSSAAWALALGSAAALLPAHVAGGEAIQFSNARSRQDPIAKSNLPGEKEGGLGRMSPLDFIPAGGDNGRTDPIRSRKENNRATERANWMVLDRGDLDARDEQRRTSGMRDAKFGKETERKDYFFAPVSEKDDLPGRSKSLSPYGKSTARERSDSDPDSKETADAAAKTEDATDSRRATTPGKEGQSRTDHTAKELDLKDLLSTTKPNSLMSSLGDKTGMMWKEVLGGGSTDSGTIRRRDDGSTADSFRGSVSSGSSRGNDSFSARNDFGSRAAAPVSPSLPDSGSRSFGLPSAPVAPRASDSSLSRGSSLYGAPAANDRSFSSGSSPGSDPYSSYRPQAQRSSSGNSQIPSRPGYGR
ncbi:MAG: hypothetical protein QOF48_1924 [Verrucomicrobiota bacterium]|jgi:hypothetical protein